MTYLVFPYANAHFRFLRSGDSEPMITSLGFEWDTTTDPQDVTDDLSASWAGSTIQEITTQWTTFAGVQVVFGTADPQEPLTFESSVGSDNGDQADRTRRAQRPGPVLLPRRAGGCCGCKRHDRLKLARRLPDPLERLDERHRRSRRRGAACSPPQRELRREPGRDPLDARAGQGGHATTQAPPLEPLRGR